MSKSSPNLGYSFMPEYLKNPSIEKDIRKIWIPYVEGLLKDKESAHPKLEKAIDSELVKFDHLIKRHNDEIKRGVRSITNVKTGESKEIPMSEEIPKGLIVGKR